ncbi:MAG: epoxyqueuosine reductase QueH [Lachnospiraceae bacterium]|nr:epoxyqueuosine reductase QueH [Lachnospiraceae bacterium]
MNRVNYQREMEKIMERHARAGEVPRLLLHSCCAPCSSAVLERLVSGFEVTVLYYNPNIYPEEEYRVRAREQERFVERFPAAHPVRFREGMYRPEDFYETVQGYEAEPEGGARCLRCYRLRLEETAREARDGGFDYFTTTLSLSPLKDAQALNAIGAELAAEYGVTYLFSDFKKKDGYRRSVELSAEYGMYRQNYCGCVYSLRRDFVKPGAQSRDAHVL